MSKIITQTDTQTVIHPDGSEEITTAEKTINIQPSNEPDFIKLYTRMWCEFNQIPLTYRGLFLELVTRMSYCNTSNLADSQLVNTGKPWSDDIMSTLGWKKAMYQKGLRILCECGAIRKIGRGVYQINPSYAGRGEWKYNPRLDRGGVEDLIAEFSFKDGKVKTSIIWADDGKESAINTIYRTGLEVEPAEQAVLKEVIYAKDA